MPPRISRSEGMEEALEDVDRHGHVGLLDRLGRVVADASAAADEQHRGGRDGGHRRGVVTGAAGQAREALPTPRLRRSSIATRRDARRVLPREVEPPRRPAISSRPAVQRADRVAARRRRRRRARRALIVARPGITLRHPGSTLDPADRRRRAGRPRPRAPTRRRPARASRRASMGTVPAWPASPSKRTLAWLWPAIAVTTPTRLAEPLEHRALLDVHLERSRAGRRGPPSPGRRAAGRRAARRPRRAASEPRGIEAAGDGRRAEVGGAEAHALLVGEADHLERERQRLGQPLDGRQRDAARRAGRRSGRRPAPCRGASRASSVPAPRRRPADQVADRVLAHGQPGLAASSRRRARSRAASRRCRSGGSGGPPSSLISPSAAQRSSTCAASLNCPGTCCRTRARRAAARGSAPAGSAIVKRTGTRSRNARSPK